VKKEGAGVHIAIVDRDSLEAAVARLQAQLAEHEMHPPAAALRGVVQTVIADARLGFLLLATSAGQPNGIAYAAAHLSAEHGGTVGWLEELYVIPEWRGCGAGSALLTEVTTRAQQQGWRALELEVVAGHERAVPLYQRHGFTRADRARLTRLLVCDRP